MPKLTVGSLFAGIGGFDLGLERAGFEIRWQVEIDPFCLAVLAEHWPRVKRYEDVRTVGAELEWVDWICGGFPCQNLSSAGTRAGLNGEQSGLYRELIRIVRARRPRGVLIENIHHAWRQWVPVLRRALWDEGYASLPIRVCAADFGAWHQRRRVFLVAHVDPRLLRLQSWRVWWPFWTDPPLFADAVKSGRSREWGTAGRARREESIGEYGGARDATNLDSAGCADSEGRGTDAREHRDRSVAADTDAMRQLQPERREPDEWGWAGDGYRWPPEPDVVRVVYGVSSRLHGRRMAARISALGNAVIPIQVEWIGRHIIAAEEGLTSGAAFVAGGEK